ncbi:uncharacterized protein [Ambystoma mexicanum]|uniref:uncharacterized protein isoform X2 n=1 Tax=Ambystoma mexicanum TaxID=8296 RepID=UPI0037E7EA04
MTQQTNQLTLHLKGNGRLRESGCRSKISFSEMDADLRELHGASYHALKILKCLLTLCISLTRSNMYYKTSGKEHPWKKIMKHQDRLKSGAAAEKMQQGSH